MTVALKYTRVPAYMKYVISGLDDLLAAAPHHLAEQHQPRLRCCGRCKCKMRSQQATDPACVAQDSLAYLLFYRLSKVLPAPK